MTKKLSPFLVTTLIIVAATFLGPSLSPAFAQNSNTPGASGDKVQDGLNAVKGGFPAGAQQASYDIPTTVHKVINWALYIAAIAAVIMLIVGGYFYIFSAGNPATVTKGRTTMINALIGLTIIVLSYLIVQIVYSFLTSPGT